MSEDLHDSNNDAPLTEVGIPCHFCGEPVMPEDSYTTDFNERDGTTKIAVFHKGLDRMCPFKWATERLIAAKGKLEAIAALFKYVDDRRSR